MKDIQIDDINALVKLVPNGITDEGNFRFAIIIGIDSKDEECKPLRYETLMEVGRNLDRHLSDFNKYFGVYVGNKSGFSPIDFSGSTIQGSVFNNGLGGSEHRWRRLFSTDKKIVLNKFKVTDDFTNPDQDFEFVYKDIECRNAGDGDDNYYLPLCGSRDNLLNRIDSVDQVFRKVDDFARDDYESKKERITCLEDGETFLFSDILSHIYEHKTACFEEFGIGFEFEVKDKALERNMNSGGSLVLTKRNPENIDESSISFLSESSNGDNVKSETGRMEPIISTYQDYIVREVESKYFDESKYFHGRLNYGLVELEPKKYYWRFKSKVQDWNDQLATTDEEPSENSEKVEGIILYHNLDVHEYKETFQKPGVLGHEIIMVQESQDSDIAINSLCARNTTYEFASDLSKVGPVEERTYINIDPAMVLDNKKDVKNNEICKIEGHNLCLQKQFGQLKRNENNEDDSRDHPEFEDFIEEDGFTFDHDYLPASNVYLRDSKYLVPKDEKLKFLIVESDAFTNYKIPIGNKVSSGSKILDLKTLIKFELPDTKGGISKNSEILYQDPNNKKNFSFNITPTNSPFDPVHILSKKVYDKQSDCDIEKNNVFLLTEETDTSERYVIPPRISFHFAQLLGHVDPLWIKAANKEEYLKSAYSLVKRSQVNIPTLYQNDQIKYLPDDRIKNLRLIADNWQSWMIIRHTLPDLLTSVFEYGSEFENYYRCLKPLKIAVHKYKSFDVSRDEEGGLHLAIPSNHELNFRLYSATTKDQLGGFVKTSIARVEKQPEVPNILDYDGPIKARRFISEGLNKTFVFYSFKLEADPKRAYLTLLNESTELIDDGSTMPKLIVKKDPRLLVDEYYRDIFKTKVGDILKNESNEIYPNKFGFSYDISGEYLTKIGKITEDKITEILRFELNRDFLVTLKSESTQGEARFSLFYSTIHNSDKFIDYIDYDGTLIFDYKYNINELVLNIYYKKRDDIKLVKSLSMDEVEAPYCSLNEKSIKIIEEFEDILTNEITEPSDFYLEFLHFEKELNSDDIPKFKITENPEYFIYRDEEDRKFKTQRFKLKAPSRYKNYYPESTPPEDFYQVSTNSSDPKKDFFEVEIPNNLKPPTPEFTLVPFFYKKAKGNTKYTKNQICIRIDRPQSEDLIGIVDAVKGDQGWKTADNTSSIGRDITKSTAGSIDGDKTKISDYLELDSLDDNNPKYLSKYYTKTIVSKIKGKEYKILLFEPCFNASDNCWQIVLDLKHLNKLDDPIAKFCLVRVQKKSEELPGNVENSHPDKDDLKISKFSNAKFIPIRSERSVTVNPLNSTSHKVSIKKNGNSKNLDSKNSLFILCYLNSNVDDPFNNKPVPIKDPITKKAKDYLLINEKQSFKEFYTLEAIGEDPEIGSLCVYEIEKHDDLPQELLVKLKKGIVDFRNHPALRIIYIEKFKI